MEFASNKTTLPHPIPEKAGIPVVLIHPHTIKDNYHEGSLGKALLPEERRDTRLRSWRRPPSTFLAEYVAMGGSLWV